jgi:small subunit ribosomal protein S15
MLDKVKKEEVVKNFGRSAKDTGSCEVQVAMLTARINQISEHLQSFPKDNHSRRGLMKLVSRREAYNKYLKRTNQERYEFVLDKLGLKK